MLAPGTINKLLNGIELESFVLQVMTLKALSNPASAAVLRYRVTLFDGNTTCNGMFTTQLNHLIENNEIKENSLIRVDKFAFSLVENNKLMIIAEAIPLGQAMQNVPVMMMPQQIPQQMPQQMPQQTSYPPAAYTNVNPVPQTYQKPPLQQPPQPPQQANYSGSTYGQANPPYNAIPSVPVTNNTPYINSYNAPPATNPTNSYISNSNYASTVPSATANPYPYPTGSAYGVTSSTNNRPVVRNDNIEDSVVPIKAINPYSNKWTIKARVTSKSPMKSWSNAKGEGTLFSIDLLDSEGGEIRATFFKEAAQRFFNVIEEQNVYYFSGGKYKVVANKQYSTIKNDYEITFDVNSDIRPCQEDSEIKKQSYKFVAIENMNNVEVGATVDVLGIVKSASEFSEITTKAQKSLLKRDIVLIDGTSTEIRVTLWGERAAEPIDWSSAPIVAIKGAKVGDYGGRSLGTLSNSSILINPDIPEAKALHNFRNSFPGGIIPDGKSLSGAGSSSDSAICNEPIDKRIPISRIKEDNLGSSEKPDWVVMKGTVNYIKHDNDPWYTACPTPQCNKKVTEYSGQFTCEKCNKSFDHCIRRYILNVTMADHTGTFWFSLFNEDAEKMLGHSADTLYQWRQNGDDAQYEKVFTDAMFTPYIFKARVKKELVKDEDRVKANITRLEKIGFVNESKLMLEAIQKF